MSIEYYSVNMVLDREERVSMTQRNKKRARRIEKGIHKRDERNFKEKMPLLIRLSDSHIVVNITKSTLYQHPELLKAIRIQ